MNAYAQSVLENLKKKYHWESEFLQAASEVLRSIDPVLEDEPRYKRYGILERIIEPERVIIFRVPWQDDRGNVVVNTGYRVQFNSALGPYKGGLRFHPSVTLSSLKFLGFEQTFKNSLTGLPLGGGKGGSDFSPTGKSEQEVMRFCQSFMNELYRHVGADTDVPAGDIGVGGREIGFLYGQYRRLTGQVRGMITGKGLNWGGSLLRPEATGFGAIYFAQEMLRTRGEALEGKAIALSGFGNVAWGAALKASQLGAKVVTISGPDGFIHDPEGISGDKVSFMLEMRSSGMDSAKLYADEFRIPFHEGQKPWNVPCDIAIPCAIQNELDGDDAKALIANGVGMVVEASNMGCTPDAIEALQHAGIPFAPGKAANAGGVATSGLEMSQNSMRLAWTAEEVDARLHQIMTTIHENCAQAAEKVGMQGDYVAGANIAGFRKVADAMIDQGIV